LEYLFFFALIDLLNPINLSVGIHKLWQNAKDAKGRFLKFYALGASLELA
jgi:hypothetical protein